MIPRALWRLTSTWSWLFRTSPLITPITPRTKPNDWTEAWKLNQNGSHSLKWRATIAPIMIKMPHPKMFNTPWLLFRFIYGIADALEPVSNKIINKPCEYILMWIYDIPDYCNGFLILDPLYPEHVGPQPKISFKENQTLHHLDQKVLVIYVAIVNNHKSIQIMTMIWLI